MSSRGETTSILLDELARTGQLTSQAHIYIDEAIDHYSRKAFWFNEQLATAQTVAGEEYLDLPADWGLEYSLSIQINSNSYPLIERTYAQMEDLYVSGSNYQGYPEDFCIYRQQIRLGPIPSQAFTLKLAYLETPDELSSDASTNIALENINSLIRMRAGRRMSGLILQDEKREATFAREEADAAREAKSKTVRYQMVGKSRPRNQKARNF